MCYRLIVWTFVASGSFHTSQVFYLRPLYFLSVGRNLRCLFGDAVRCNKHPLGASGSVAVRACHVFPGHEAAPFLSLTSLWTQR